MFTQQLLESKYGKNNQKVKETMAILQTVQEKTRYVQLMEKYDPETLINPAAGVSDELIMAATKQGIIQSVNNITTLSRALDASYHNQQIQPLTITSVYDRSVYNQPVFINAASEAEKRLNQEIQRGSGEEVSVLNQNQQLKTLYQSLRTQQTTDDDQIQQLREKIQEGQQILEKDKEYTQLLKQRQQWQRGTCNQIEKQLKTMQI